MASDEVIDMVAMLERRMAAIRTVNVRMGEVCVVVHRFPLFMDEAELA